MRAKVNGHEIPGNATVHFTEHSEVDGELVLTQSVDRRFSSVGETLTFTITVENHSDGPISEVHVTNYLHDGLEYVDGSASPMGVAPLGIRPMSAPPSPYDPVNQTLSWTIPVLQPGKDQAVRFAFQATVGAVDEGTLLTNLLTAQRAGSAALASTTVATLVTTWPHFKGSGQARRSTGGLCWVARALPCGGDQSR